MELTAAATAPLNGAGADYELTVHFAGGLVGCADWEHFEIVTDSELAPLYLINCQDDPSIGFIGADPTVFKPDFCLQLSPEDEEHLGYPEFSDLLVLAIITPASSLGSAAEPTTTATINLLGPLVINSKRGIGRQVIQSEYTAHHSVGG
jgi:flagellar assembly factor FliW